MKGHSIVHINYKENRIPIFEHSAVYMWFDLFGLFGGLCGITFGGSIITLIELIYYCTGRFASKFTSDQPKLNSQNKKRIRKKIATLPSPPTISIYFNELNYNRNKVPHWKIVRPIK